ncbi:hypothetical protein PMI07_004927 [Rhizobium sp. CF080]|uniref:hypothetical protein n=1 Tax=Rhizobium sp. (strain CF080) TaxID=1144310 RepID=UPI000271D6C6|nr:hypothetical protein [Rhizobium sp. CF080]EUB98646.1 hypothetical protein PMI07_004927 [Rhizobium sp. CF080]
MKTLALMTCALLLPLAASAQQPQTNRFQLQRTETGIVRLDTETGAMTVCRDENGTLACRMQPDERAAYEQELDRLAKRVTALEERLSHTPPDALKALPSDAEVDRSLSIMEKFMRRFMAIVGEFANEREADRPQPNRT